MHVKSTSTFKEKSKSKVFDESSAKKPLDLESGKKEDSVSLVSDEEVLPDINKMTKVLGDVASEKDSKLI